MRKLLDAATLLLCAALFAAETVIEKAREWTR